MKLIARHYETSSWIELSIEGGRIAEARPVVGPDVASDHEEWAAPAFWDIQLNGRWGHSFSGPDLTAEHVREIVRAQAALGTARLCPTLITAPVDHLQHGLKTIAEACSTFPDVSNRAIGVHLEGPFLSGHAGYRGAHPVEAMRDPDWGLFEDLQAASGGRIALITIAPERRGAIEFIERATASGTLVALGHTAAEGPALQRAVAAGARLSTHLGNGIASPLPRHPNPIWEQAAIDDLAASFIADGHHLDLPALRVLARAKGPNRTVLVSDASPLAGLPVGTYGEWAVDASGKIVVAGTPYLAGSNQGLETGLRNLAAATGWSLAELFATVTTGPARLLGRAAPRLASGEPANLVVFRLDGPNGLTLDRCCVDGEWTRCGEDNAAA